MTDCVHVDPEVPEPGATPTPSEAEMSRFVNEPCQPFARDNGEAPFHDSWEAEAYAMGNLLVKMKHVTSKEWMDLMAESIREAQAFGDPDTGETYYNHWCRSLEKFCFKTGLSNPAEHQEKLKLWRAAIINTPHDVPLSIENAFLPETHHDDLHDPIAHGHFSLSTSVAGDAHTHSHERPPIPPETYYKPIAKQIIPH